MTENAISRCEDREATITEPLNQDFQETEAVGMTPAPSLPIPDKIENLNSTLSKLPPTAEIKVNLETQDNTVAKPEFLEKSLSETVEAKTQYFVRDLLSPEIGVFEEFNLLHQRYPIQLRIKKLTNQFSEDMVEIKSQLKAGMNYFIIFWEKTN